MRILKEKGEYLKKQIKSNNTIAIILLIIGLVTLIFYGLGIIFTGISIYFFVKSNQYKKGQDGENLIIECLKKLNDNYQLINDVVLPESYGNIDHLLLGPNGVFVIETKNYNGEIICNGDEWYNHYDGEVKISMKGRPYYKPGRDYDIKSPSKQIKKNAAKLKQFIEKELNKKIWIEVVVVFTNPEVNLELNHPTVPILKINDVYNYIKNKKAKIGLSLKDLESIERIILGLKNA
jgi:hypothetical protein